MERNKYHYDQKKIKEGEKRKKINKLDIYNLPCFAKIAAWAAATRATGTRNGLQLT